MKKVFNNLQYGIFIDQKKAVLVRIDEAHEVNTEDFRAPSPHHYAGETTSKTGLFGRTLNRQSQDQRKKEEDLKKWCKSLVAKMVKAGQIYIFGPSDTKYMLQHEVERRKTLQHAYMEVETTDKLNRNEVIRNVKKHFRIV